MAQYAMGNPAFATGNDAMDQGLGSLASAFFPDPSKVASAGYYGAKTRETMIDAQTKQGTLDARGQLQNLIAGVNNGAVPNLHPGSVTDPDGGQKMSGPAAADGSPAAPSITIPQIMERAAAAGYDAQSAGHIASSVVAQMYARGVIDKNTYVTMMTGAGNAAPLTAQTEITKQGMVTGEQRRQFDETPITVTDASGKEIQITRGQFNAAPKGTYFGAREADPTLTSAEPGGAPTHGRRLTSDGKYASDLPTYVAGQKPTEYTDDQGVVRLGPQSAVTAARPKAPSEGTLVKTAPTAGAPGVFTRATNAPGQIAADDQLTRQQLTLQPVVDPNDPTKVRANTVAGAISGSLELPPPSLDAQQALGARALTGFQFQGLGPDATPQQKAGAVAGGLQTTRLATTAPDKQTPQEGAQFETLIDQETDRRFRPTGKAGEFGETAVLAPGKRQAVVALANQLRTGTDPRFRDNPQAAIAEAFNRLQADKTIPAGYDRNKPGWSYVSQDARIRQRNIADPKTGATRTQKYLEIGQDGPSVAGTIANAAKPTPGATPQGSLGPAPPNVAEGQTATGSNGVKAINRGGFMFPVQ